MLVGHVWALGQRSHLLVVLGTNQKNPQNPFAQTPSLSGLMFLYSKIGFFLQLGNSVFELSGA